MVLSTSTDPSLSDIIRIAAPVGVGIASVFYLAKLTRDRNAVKGVPIPIPSIRAGDATHDTEYFENPDAFLLRCEEEYGPVFNCYLFGRQMIIVSGPLVREVFLTEHLNFQDVINEISGVQAMTKGILKSHAKKGNKGIRQLVSDNIFPNISRFASRIEENFRWALETNLGQCENKLIERPLEIIQIMVARTMASVLMGPEIAKDSDVINSFAVCTADFATVLGKDYKLRWWQTFTTKAKYNTLNPLQKHVKVLMNAATPVVLERRRQENEAVEKGIPYDRPLDVLQMLLDNFDRYQFVDLEDICGHLLVLALASVHATSDSATTLCSYLATFPEHIERLYEEQQEVLGQVEKEHQELRQKKLESGEVANEQDFENTYLDPKNDRAFTTETVKKLVHMDSFVRECMRHKHERLSLPHKARTDVELGNGMVIPKGKQVIVNIRSVHHGETLQGEDPTEFRPWRFVGKSKAAIKVSSGFLTFGMGSHACPGRFLAIYELKTFFSLIIANYSKITLQEPPKTQAIPIGAGVLFTSR
ncbi:hypothetical protein BGZ80_008069 [Entomortierella chlamydospora]|uniref:Cytochrome p450 n=1 Tax=Entomortierella chlamydospora TaxID=101097 RepID=A0A9P6MYI2_9FUNG|nr:hypothetical protein BGZ80_008069 [Entomortierella chlamydospora]